MIHVNVRERDAAAQATEPITAGSVGLAVSFRFSADWDGLAKAAVFRGSGRSVEVALATADSCEVPWEVLQSAGGHLKIGVYGTGRQGQQVTPSIWADAGQILEGAEPSELTPAPAAASLAQQVLEAAAAAREAAERLREDADNGAFDGAPGTNGKSAYELAAERGYPGTEAQWLQSLHGQDAAVDATLSNVGEAADAAATGAGISTAQHSADYALRFAETLNNGAGIPLDAAWLEGGYGADRPYRVHSKRAVNTEQKVLQAAAGYRFYLRIYSDGSSTDSSWYGPDYASRKTYTLPKGADFSIVVSTYPEDTSVTADPDVYGSKITIKNNIGSGGGSITVDHALSGSSENPVQNKVIKAALDEKYEKPSGGIPGSDLAENYLTRHQDISGKLDADQGAANAGKFLVVGSDGNVTAVTMTAWQGGSY